MGCSWEMDSSTRLLDGDRSAVDHQCKTDASMQRHGWLGAMDGYVPNMYSNGWSCTNLNKE